ncbi:MAG: alanyl-tRNA editing protein AlaXM [Candidatus Aenigmatarchaeota archaeon]
MEALYLADSYLKEFEATVKQVNDGKFIVLNQTAFYPSSGGQPHDTGVMVRESDGKEFKVVFTGKFSGQISHEVDQEGLQPEDKVNCRLDWDRRYKLMRMHTAAHIISAILYKEAGALITGNQLDLDKSRIDFSLEHFDREKLIEYIQKSNEYVQRDLEVRISQMPREEVEQDPELVKLAKGLPPGIKVLRIVEIVGLDKQPDGGTHVKSLKEVGTIKFLKAENKGKNNRRMYYTLE